MVYILSRPQCNMGGSPGGASRAGEVRGAAVLCTSCSDFLVVTHTSADISQFLSMGHRFRHRRVPYVQ